MSVLVYTENWDGKFKKSTFELLSYANEIAKKLNTETIGISIGNVSTDELSNLGNYGANKVLSFSDSRISSLENTVFSSIISQAAIKVGAQVIILSNNLTGKAIAPRLSVKLKAGLVSAVVALPSSVEPFEVKKKAFTGSAFANVKVNSAIKILTLSQNSYQINQSEDVATVENFEATINNADFKTKVTDTQKTTGKIILNDAEIIVSGGRGMKGPENWGAIEELASVLGAGTACSRPVSDEGWRSHDEHVGQTGKIVAPNLYFAIGISGAVQHVAGVSGSKCIVAVNTDKDATVFEVADYGIVGDARQVLPSLIEAFKEFKAEH